MAYISFQPSDFFNTILYTGDSGAAQAQTGVGFSADLTWIKDRDSSEEHVWTDTVRGATYWIRSNATNAQGSIASLLQSWQSDGFTVGNNGVVGTTDDYVAWNWKAGTTTGLTGGTITPSAYSFNATPQVGIYKRTGTASAGTITHGLGGVPKMIITKNLTDTANWRVYHTSIGSGNGINLNETAGDYSDANLWNGTDPTSTVYSIGSSNDTNKSGSDFIDYVFCPVKGFSSIGKYTGNGNAYGPFVYTGFRPAFIMLKRWNATSAWMLFDTKRLGYNADNNALNPNLTDAAGSTDYLDINSNGFKFRTSDSLVNHSGGYFLYMAFAEFPTVSSNDIPGVGR